MKENIRKYFLAANSCRGFVSEFLSNCSNDYKTYIIKGGPGTGKSSFMKKVAAFAEAKGEAVIYCPCSSDPQSLDGIICEKSKIIIVDGTAPHTVDPVYPAVAQEILNFGEFWDSEKFKNKADIIEITNCNKALHKTAARYITAAGEMLYDNFKTATACTDTKKCKAFAEKLCKNIFNKTNRTPKETVRFIGGITPNGFVAFPNTPTQNLIIISDDFFAVSSYILNIIRKNALASGYDIITLKSPFFPELIDHIIIPELDFAIVSENRFINFENEQRRIHARRFYDSRLLHQSKNRIKFNKRLAAELLDSAYFTLGEAKKVHDELEKHYINAMDFEKLNNFTDMFCKKHF
ncbi:MAG: ATPase [Clostridia bacterium]|nr:ATPase [Clostridia bacterium]